MRGRPCVRKYPRGGLVDCAREHTRRCALMGHCVESGYALIDDQDRMTLLDAKATLLIVAALEDSERDHGIRLRATREAQGHEMETSAVEEVDASTA